MKIGIILISIFVLLAISPTALLTTWVASSPFVDNFVARPHQNPFFASYRLIDRFTSIPGFDIRELFSYDRMVLALLVLVILVRKDSERIKFPRLDYPFLMLIGAVLIGSLYSHNIVHRIRVATDTVVLSYFAYFIGKNMLCKQKQFDAFLKGLLALGCVLTVVSISEYYVHRNIFLYRITGPFLYWENLGLALAFIFFIVIYKKATAKAGKKITNAFYKLLLILLGLCIFLAQTRTIMVGMIISLVFISIKGRAIVNKKGVKKYAAYALLFIVVIAVNPMLLKSTNFYQHRLTKRTDKGRVELYETAIRVFIRNPLWGIGFRDFYKDKMHYVTKKEIETGFIHENGDLHSSFLAVASELGLMGFIPMILLSVLAFKTCLEYYDLANDRSEKFWALTMLAMLVTYFLLKNTFDPFFEPTIDNKIFYLCLGVTAGKYKRLICNS